MRSIHLQSLLSGVFLLSCSTCQAQHLYGRESHRVRYRHPSNLSGSFETKYKRDANVPFTYFADGQGACGATNGPNDFIVALNAAEYGDGSHCFEMITITVGGKTAQAQITDRCEGCQTGGLDFSQGLFELFAPLDSGQIYGSWSYNSDETTSSSTPAPLTTTYTPTSATLVTTTSSSTASTTTPTTSLASTVVPTQTMTTTTIVPTSTTQDPQIIAQINLAFLELSRLLDASLGF